MTDKRGLMVHDTDQARHITSRLESQSKHSVRPMLWLGKYVVSRGTVARETPELILAPSPVTVRQSRPAVDAPSSTGTDATKSLSKQPEMLAGVAEDNEHRPRPDNITPEASAEIIADFVYRVMRRDIMLDRERRPGSDRPRFR